MNKQLTKKILLTIGLLLLMGIIVFRVVYDLNMFLEHIKDYNNYKDSNNLDHIQTLIYQGARKNIFRNAVFLFFDFICVCIFIFIIYKTWKTKITSIKYAYQDYRKEMQLKKEKKQKRKIEKYEAKIQNLKK